MGKHTEYPAQTTVMNNLKDLRERRGLHASDMARIVREATDYHFTTAMYDACEKGITKNVPLWVVIALLSSEEIWLDTADRIFADVMPG
jgi:hypothetical protein